MHSKSDNIDVMAYDNLDEIIEELFKMGGTDFIFDCVNVLYYKGLKIRD